MGQLDFGNAHEGSALTAVTIDSMNTDGAGDDNETRYSNTDWPKYWGYFNKHPELKSAILMKAIWNVGKGFEVSDPKTQTILDHISGWGKDTFEDILFNMEVNRRIGGDAFAEIIRDEKTDTIVNLKVLDPGSVDIICDKKGILKRYEQRLKIGTKQQTYHKFNPDEILHLTNNRLADQIHGISDIESLDTTVLAELESFQDCRKTMRQIANPFIIFHLKSDDPTKIAALDTKMKNVRNDGDGYMIIPDDENIITTEVVQLNVNQIILQWRNDVIGRFYRALGMPMILFGAQGSTESGSKMEYFAHEQVFEHDQRFIEKQLWNQLQIKIDLTPPTSMAQDLGRDEAKDANQGLEIQPSDTTAGVGR